MKGIWIQNYLFHFVLVNLIYTNMSNYGKTRAHQHHICAHLFNSEEHFSLAIFRLSKVLKLCSQKRLFGSLGLQTQKKDLSR